MTTRPQSFPQITRNPPPRRLSTPTESAYKEVILLRISNFINKSATKAALRLVEQERRKSSTLHRIKASSSRLLSVLMTFHNRNIQPYFETISRSNERNFHVSHPTCTRLLWKSSLTSNACFRSGVASGSIVTVCSDPFDCPPLAPFPLWRPFTFSVFSLLSLLGVADAVGGVGRAGIHGCM